MAVTFDEDPRLVAIAISGEIMTALVRFDAIMSALDGCVCPPATMVIDDFFSPVAHRLDGLLDSRMIDLLPPAGTSDRSGLKRLYNRVNSRTTP